MPASPNDILREPEDPERERVSFPMGKITPIGFFKRRSTGRRQEIVAWRITNIHSFSILLSIYSIINAQC